MLKLKEFQFLKIYIIISVFQEICHILHLYLVDQERKCYCQLLLYFLLLSNQYYLGKLNI